MNRRRVLWLVGIVLLCGGTFAALYGYRRAQVRREVLSWRTAGLEAERAGDAGMAVEQLSRYLRRNPDDADALFAFSRARLLAPTADEREARQEAISALRQLLRADPGGNYYRERLLQLYVQAGNDALAIETADALLAKVPDDETALQYKAAALMDQHDWKRAQPVLERWTWVRPLDVEAQCALLAVLRQTGSRDAVLRRAMSIRELHRGDGRFEMVEAFALRLLGLPAEPADAPDAERLGDARSVNDWLLAAAAHAPKPPDVKFTRALVRQLDQLGMFAESLAALRGAAASGDAQVRRDLARRLWENALWEESLPLLQAGENDPPKLRSEALGMEGIALARLDRPADVMRVHALLAARPNDAVAAGWRSILERLAQPGRTDSKAWLELCRQAAIQDSDNPYLRYYLAEAYTQLGESDIAVTLLQDATLRNLTWALAPATLAEQLLALGRTEAAARAAEEAQRRAAPNGKLNDLGIALILARAWDAQLRAAEKPDPDRLRDLTRLVVAVQQAAPGEETTLAIQISLLARSGDAAGAKKALDAALRAQSPMSESLLLNLGTISRDNKLGLEDACFARSEREHGLGANLAFARAVNLFQQGQAETGKKLLESARERSGHADALSWRIARARYLDLTTDPAARPEWETIADQQPDNLAVQQMAIIANATRTDRPFTERAIQRLRQLSGDQGVLWRLARARWLVEDPSPQAREAEEASTLLNSVLRIAPDSPDAHWLLGRALRQFKNFAGAAEQLQAAASLSRSSGRVALELAQVQIERGETSQARQTLLQLTTGPRATPAALFALARLDEQANDEAAAEVSYRRALQLAPNDGALLDAFAQSLIRRGDAKSIAEAVTLAASATQSAPKVPDYLRTLAMAQAKAGDSAHALASIERAIALSGSDVRSRVLQLQFLLDAGRQEEARKALAALDGHSDTAAMDYATRTQLDGLRRRVRALRN